MSTWLGSELGLGSVMNTWLGLELGLGSVVSTWLGPELGLGSVVSEKGQYLVRVRARARVSG